MPLKHATESSIAVFPARLQLVLLKQDGAWWMARKEPGGEEGLVPSNYVEKLDKVTI